MNKTINTLLIAGGLAISVGAQAALSDSAGPQTTDLGAIPLTLDQFSGGGTLTGVTLTVTGTSESTTSLANGAAQAQRFAFDSNLAWEFEILLGSGNFFSTFTTNLATTGGPVTLGSGETLDLGTTTDSGSQVLSFAGADLAQFIGSGNIQIGCNTLTSSTFAGGGGNINNIQVSTGLCGASIEYASDTPPPAPTPEPTTLWLLGAGLVGFSRFRAKKAS